jgi:hypothetical protein
LSAFAARRTLKVDRTKKSVVAAHASDQHIGTESISTSITTISASLGGGLGHDLRGISTASQTGEFEDERDLGKTEMSSDSGGGEEDIS